MKYAIISDIHGNMPALKLVLEDAKQQGVDGYLLGGDYSLRAPWFNEVIPTLRSLPNAYAVCGNEEKYLHLPEGEDAQFAICYWAAKQMQPENLAWLDSLPEQVDVMLNGVPVHLTHHLERFLGREIAQGFHTSRLPILYPERPISPERFQADARQLLLNSPTLPHVLEKLPAGVYVFGHNHAQWNARFGDHLFINPGSCGHPIDCMPFGACYAVLTIENGTYEVVSRRIPYDPKPLIQQAMQTGQYQAAPVWSSLIFMDWCSCSEHIFSFLRYVESYAKRIGDDRRPFMRDTWQAAFDEWGTLGYPLYTLENN